MGFGVDIKMKDVEPLHIAQIPVNPAGIYKDLDHL